MMRAALVSVALAPVATVDLPFVDLDYPACATGFTCGTISPVDKPGLTFDCAWITAPDEKGAVLYAHGNDGKLSKGMFFETMSQVASLGYSGLSCDQRGYSPGAAPDDLASYNYDILATDLFSLMDASNLSAPYGGKFHMVAHDQGARVSWHAIAKGGSASEGRKRFLSYTSLSIPHSDVFSDALLGPDADYDSQVAQQYVRMLVLPNSTTIYNKQIYNMLCVGEGWTDINTCQKTLWWYNGAIDSGAMGLAPMEPYDELADEVGIPKAIVENLTQYPLTGVAQTVKVGPVSEFPVFYACGYDDRSDLCKPKFGEESKALIQDFSYLRVPNCSHQVLACSGAQGIIDGIIANIQSSTVTREVVVV
jgi:pimeloyl-ACP methyl ester carboxylesterase